MTARNRRVRAALVAASFVFSSSSVAWAFRTIADYPEVPDDARVRWPSGGFEFWTYEGGTDDISAEALAQTSRFALSAWAEAPCARIVPMHMGITPHPAAAGDGFNTIQIVESDWESLGYPKDAAAATDVYFEEQDDGTWAIVEADILVNAEHHRFTTAETPEDDERSLLGVLTHEAGHALGLLHPCEPDGADDAPICEFEDAPDDLMSPYYASDQISPEEDDLAGLCHLYSACEAEGCQGGFRCVEGECLPLDGDDDGDGACDEGSGGQGAECTPPKLSTGARCTEANECSGGECVAGVEDVPICTQRCGDEEQPCPFNWTCSNVEDRSVCIPPNPDQGCACVLARPQSPFGKSNVRPEFLLIAGVVVSLRRLARKRISIGTRSHSS
jgi:hypothetical protein